MNDDTDIPTLVAKHLFRLWKSAPETNEDGTDISPSDYIEFALHVALRGEGHYKTSVVKRRLSGDNQITAPTKLPAGPVTVRSEQYNSERYRARTEWEICEWVVRAEKLLQKLEIGPAEASGLTALGMAERELAEEIRDDVPSKLVDDLRARGRACDASPNSGQDRGTDEATTGHSSSQGLPLTWLGVRPTPHMDMSDSNLEMPAGLVQPDEIIRSSCVDTDLPRLKRAREPADDGTSDENISQLSGEGEKADDLSSGKGRQDTENNSQDSEYEWSWKPDDLRRRTCDHSTREAIFEHVPAARNDNWLFRYSVYVLWSDFTDRQCGLQVLPESACDWIGEYANDTAIEVIDHIREHLDITVVRHIPNRRCRLIEEDGLPAELERTVTGDLSTQPSNYKSRVYVLSGAPYTPKKLTRRREEIAGGLQAERHRAPSVGAQKTFEMLNFGCGEDLRSGRLLSKMKDHLDEAFKYVRRMDIDADISKSDDESWEDWRRRKWKEERNQRQQYLSTLSAIADQHQQFYSYSSTGRTDRLFAYNRSVLDLPKEVRSILCQDFVEVDLKSAHLLIAAWLWDADRALEKLRREDYSIWDDLMQHYEKLFHTNDHDVPDEGEDLYRTVKSALKQAVYSAVYGMHAPSIQAEVTKDLEEILGPEAGAHFRGHPVIAELLKKRDEKLARMEVGDVLTGPTGIRIEIEQGYGEDGDDVDPRSAMATLAQSYEQAAMQVILEMERDRQQSDSYNYFQVALWLHDGAYVRLRSRRARSKDLNQRLRERCKELAVHAGKNNPMPAFFEIEAITPSKQPDQTCEANETRASKARVKNSSKSRTKSESAAGAESPSRVSLKSAGSATSTAAANDSSERAVSSDQAGSSSPSSQDIDSQDIEGDYDPVVRRYLKKQKRRKRKREERKRAIREESRRVGAWQLQRDDRTD